MNTISELHDSTVAEIAKREGTIIVHFQPAYLHKSEGRPGFDSGTGWVQNARLVFSEASASGNFPDFPCEVMDGEFLGAGGLHDNAIPVTFEAMAFTELRLRFDSIHTVIVSGRGVRLELLGEPSYVEEFKP